MDEERGLEQDTLNAMNKLDFEYLSECRPHSEIEALVEQYLFAEKVRPEKENEAIGVLSSFNTTTAAEILYRYSQTFRSLFTSTYFDDEIDKIEVSVSKAFEEFDAEVLPKELKMQRIGVEGLHASCADGRISEVADKLEAGIDVETRNSDGETLLMTAVISNQLEMVKYLLEKGANPNMEKLSLRGYGPFENIRDTPFTLAAENGRTEILQALLEFVGSNEEFYVSWSACTLALAGMNGHASTVALLMQADIDLDRTDKWIAASETIRSGSFKGIQALLDAGVNPNSNDLNRHPTWWFQKSTLLSVAATCGNLEIAKLLISRGALQYWVPKNDGEYRGHPTPEGNWALTQAIRNNHPEITKLFVETENSFNECDFDGNSPLHIACQLPDRSVHVRILLEAGADTEQENRQGQTPLMSAQAQGISEAEQLLLQFIEEPKRTLSFAPDRLVMHRFSNAADIERLFQTELDRLPRKDGRPVITEFGGVMVGLGDSPSHRLTHIAFPHPMLGVPYGANLLRSHSSRTAPQATLMACRYNGLYLKLSSNRETKDGMPERLSLVLRVGEDCQFNTDIWEAFSDRDKETLSQIGFSAGMTNEKWGRAINYYLQGVKPLPHVIKDQPFSTPLRELDVPCIRYGVVGALNSYHFMPEFLAAVLDINRFVYPGEDIPENEEEIPYEIGSVHIHPDFDQLSPEQEYVAARIGENVVRRSPSVADISSMRGSRFLHSDISQAYRNCDNNTLESFLGIITVDVNGQVTGSRYYDLGEIDSEVLVDVNDRADETLNSSSPDYEVILEHYQMFDQISKTDFGTPESAPHVGALES